MAVQSERKLVPEDMAHAILRKDGWQCNHRVCGRRDVTPAVWLPFLT